MSAESIATALNGSRSGDGWVAPCPAHDDHNPSLSIRDAGNGKVLVHCHAGCPQERVIEALRSRGLWEKNVHRRFTRTERCAAANKKLDREDTKHVATEILHILTRSVPIAGTLAETYLKSRGLFDPHSDDLRFCDNVTDYAARIGRPAMIAIPRRSDGQKTGGIHRTYLAYDGSGKADIPSAKMMLGLCRGGAVQLAAPRDVLMVGEGIETCLSAMQATGNPAWAALSTSGLRALDLPNDVRDVIVLADGDYPGETAARDCAWRWSGEGRRVRIARPPQGMDFNDMLLGPARRDGDAQ